MIREWCAWAGAALVVASCTTVDGAGLKPPPALADSDAAAVDAYVQDWLRASNGVGVSVSVVKDGQPVLSKGYGLRALAPEAPVDADTLFAVGSVTKQFTVACVLLLAEDGKLSVFDRVSKWYPDLTRAGDISLLDLIHHVSGYRDYYPLDFVDARMAKASPADDVIAQYAGRPLDFEPGTRFSYSNTGYLIWAAWSNGSAGCRLANSPTGACSPPWAWSTRRTSPLETRPASRRGTPASSTAPTVAAPEALGWLGPAAGLWSTPSDLARWNAALLAGRVVNAGSWAVMITPRQLANGAMTRYAGALGPSTRDGALVLSHTGAVSGFRSASLFDHLGTSVVVLTNLESVDPSPLADTIFDQVRSRFSIPRVAGLKPVEAVRVLVAQLQAGSIDRRDFSNEFAAFMNSERLAAAKAKLGPLGLPTSVKLVSTSERGGLEVAKVTLTYATESWSAIMYRRPDGVVEELLLTPGLD